MAKRQPLLQIVEDAESNENKGKYVEQTIGAFLVPYPYENWEDGLYLVHTSVEEEPEPATLIASPSGARRSGLRRITFKPIWIKSFGRTVDTDEQLIELAFHDALTDGTVRTLWVDRSQISSKNSICALARHGVPVNEANYLSLMHYLDAALHLNGLRLPIRHVVSRTGYYKLGQYHGWMLGKQWIGPPHLIATPDPRGLSEAVRGFCSSGDEQEWYDAFTAITAYGPVARWLLYSGFAAPLLRHVDERTFIVHHYGTTGIGKTAMLKFVLSIWGDPKRLMMHFNRTEKSFVEVFNYMTDVPIAFDELQASKRGSSMIQLIYNMVLEQGRGRAQQTGGLLETVADWSTIVRTTGEEELTSRDREQELGGASARVMQLKSVALTTDKARALHKWLARGHYGFAGRRFLRCLQELLEEEGGRELLVERFAQLRDAILTRAAEIPAIHSRAGQLGVVALAHYLVSRWFFNVDPAVAVEEAVSDGVHVATILAEREVQQPVAAQALQLFHDHFVGRRHLWYDLTREEEAKIVAENRQKQCVGLVTEDEVWLIQREANALLRQHDYPPRLVWNDLLDHNLLVRPQSSGGSFGAPKKFGLFYAKVYVLKRKQLALGNPFAPA